MIPIPYSPFPWVTNTSLGVTIFHAGTEKRSDGALVTAGGRVLSVVAYGSTVEEATSLAYQGIQSITFQDMYYRKDIASR